MQNRFGIKDFVFLVVLLATLGSVWLSMVQKTRMELAQQGMSVRIVSVPSTTVFDRQSADYRAQVLPKGLPRVAVEAGVTDFWWKYGVDAVVGIDSFGESAPAAVLNQHFGFTAENVADTVREVLRRRASEA